MSAMRSDEDDARLVARCRQGDGAAWALLVDRYQRLVYAIVLRAGLDEHMAADVFQVVFMRLMDHLPHLEQPGRLQAWIVTTTRREAQRQRQKARRMVSITDSDDGGLDGREWDIEDDTPAAEESLAHLQQMNEVRSAMDSLDERCRALLLMLARDTDERLSYEEVAQRMGMSVGSIGPTRARCLDKLRRLVVERE